MNNNEIFIYYGKYSGYHVFTHLVMNGKNNQFEISSKIMNVMIDKGIITEYDSVIIFETNLYKNETNLYYIYGKDKRNIEIDEMKKIYCRINCKKLEDEFEIITYDGEKYLFHKVNIKVPCFDNNFINITNININSVTEIMTLKTRSNLHKKNDYDDYQKKWYYVSEDRSHKKYEQCKDIYISTFNIINKDDRELTISSKTEGINQYLPKTDIILLFDKFGNSKMFYFNSFCEKFKDRIEVLRNSNKKDIIYYKINFFPNDDEMEGLKLFQF